MNSHKQEGFTLVELLIALIIVALGALGHAKMQMNSMRNAQRVSFSQSANIALQDLVQRIRALPNAALAGEFNMSIGTGPGSTKLCNDSGVTCSRSEFASFELSDWYEHISTTLPTPQFSIVQDSNLFTLTLIWDADKSGSDTSVCDGSGGANQCGSVNLWIR